MDSCESLLVVRKKNVVVFVYGRHWRSQQRLFFCTCVCEREKRERDTHREREDMQNVRDNVNVGIRFRVAGAFNDLAVHRNQTLSVYVCMCYIRGIEVDRLDTILPYN